MIGFDLDGVLADFNRPFLEVAKIVGAYAGELYDTPDQPTWHYDFDTAPVWADIRKRFNWWLTLPPLEVPAAYIAIERIARREPVAFVTSRSATRGLDTATQAEIWLASFGISGPGVRVEVAHDKGAVLKRLGVTTFLDDRNLEDIRAAGIDAVARGWRYNAEWDGPRVGSVAEFLDYARVR